MLQPVPEASSKHGKGSVIALPQQENKPKNQVSYSALDSRPWEVCQLLQAYLDSLSGITRGTTMGP